MSGWVPSWPHPLRTSNIHYENAPIVEAIIEARTSGGDVGLDKLESFVAHLDGWAGAETMEVRRLRSSGHRQDSVTDVVEGYGFVRADRGRRIHVTADSVAFGWLDEYEHWELLVSEFLPVWAVFEDLGSPSQIVRLATRFVNLIKIPSSYVEITDYLRTRVDVSPNLPQTFDNFFMQVDVPLDPRCGLGVVITSAVAEAEAEDQTAVVLDLDTYDTSTIDLDGRSDDVLARRLVTLREVKNYVFEASITDATRGLIR